jgi:DNA polymerase III subunit beta
MRFVCPRSELHRALQTAARATPTRTVLPILSNVLIEAREDRLTLTCYDQEVGVRVELAARVETAGDTTIPARLFSEVLGDLPEADVAIVLEERNSIRVSCEKSIFTLAGLSADEFPRLPEVDEGTRMTLPAPLLREIIKQTIFAVSPDDTRPALTGVHFSAADGKLTAAATDTHRLSIREAVPAELFGTTEAIVPERALDQFVRATPADATEEVEFRLSHNQALLHCRDVTVVSRLIEGPFPNYQRVVPSSYEKLVTLDRATFQRSVHATIAQTGLCCGPLKARCS